MTRLKELFSTVVGIDSESGEEKDMADFLMNYLQNLGYFPERDTFDNIYCRIGSGENPILFCAHQDTVSPGKSIKVLEKDGIWWSEGDTILGADNKVSLVAMLRALEIHHEQGHDVNIELLFSVREETSSGVSDFDATKLSSKLAYVFDGGGLGFDLGWCVMGAPFIDDLFIEVNGKPAHASKPENGINALEILIESGVQLGRIDETTVMNIGIIKGGTAMNTIPGQIVMDGDIRSHEEDLFIKAKEDFTQKLSASATRFGGEAIIRWDTYAFGYKHDANTSYFKKTKELYQQHGIELQETIAPTGSDAGFLNANGVTTYCLGDGVYKAHTVDEHVEIKVFEKLVDIIVDMMQNQNLAK